MKPATAKWCILFSKCVKAIHIEYRESNEGNKGLFLLAKGEITQKQKPPKFPRRAMYIVIQITMPF